MFSDSSLIASAFLALREASWRGEGRVRTVTWEREWALCRGGWGEALELQVPEGALELSSQGHCPLHPES